ncbi:MAG: acyl carrier protein [Eubacterium sp.]|nr:acyl carrier protein [Eubacterium sp.]
MDRNTLDQELKGLIGDVMPELTDVDFGKDMVTEYGVNSISIIRLIVAAEEKFGISFSDYELSLDAYGCFSDVAALIAKKLEDKE